MLKKKTRPIKMLVESLLQQGKRSKNKKTAGTRQNILSYGSALWRFLETDGIEPKNNLAERLPSGGKPVLVRNQKQALFIWKEL